MELSERAYPYSASNATAVPGRRATRRLWQAVAACGLGALLPGSAFATAQTSSFVSIQSPALDTCYASYTSPGTSYTGGYCPLSGSESYAGSLSASAAVASERGASGAASNNLADGSLHAIVDGRGGGRGDAGAQYQDVLHFTIAGATATTVTPIQFELVADGHLTFADAYDGTTGVTYSTSFNNELLKYTATQSGYQTSFITNPSDTVTINTIGLGGVDLTFTLQILGATYDLPVISNLGCHASFGGDCDYANTATLNYISQPGVTFTSDSGVFLTAQAAVPVPEPSTLLLLGMPIGLLGMLAHRRGQGATI